MLCIHFDGRENIYLSRVTCSECGISCRVKPKIINWVFAASPPGTQHSGVLTHNHDNASEKNDISNDGPFFQ
jgi:hypothetical protein